MNPPTAKTGQNFATVDLGKFEQLQQYTFAAPDTPLTWQGKIFLKQLLGLTSAEISLNAIPPKKSVPFYHKHRLNEEIYIFVGGEGEFQVGDRVFPVAQGTVVRVDPDGERCMRNTSDTQALYIIVVQSQAGSYLNHTIEDGVEVQKKVSWVGKERI